jgi:hypothetical protein
MGWPIYTETFLRCAGVDTTHRWTVPSNKRAVIKSVSAVQLNGALGTVEVSINGVYLTYAVFQAVATVQTVALTAVCYRTQELKVILRTGNVHCHVSGYLFDDVVGTAVDRADVERGQVDELEELPARPP